MALQLFVHNCVLFQKLILKVHCLFISTGTGAGLGGAGAFPGGAVGLYPGVGGKDTFSFAIPQNHNQHFFMKEIVHIEMYCKSFTQAQCLHIFLGVGAGLGGVGAGGAGGVYPGAGGE